MDDVSNAIAPLTAVKLRQSGIATVRLVTRWPMVGMETIADVYHDWILPKLYETGVEIIVNHFVRSIAGNSVEIYNVHYAEHTRTLKADTIVMVTGRQSVNGLEELVRARGISVEAIGDATAPRRNLRGGLRGASGRTRHLSGRPSCKFTCGPEGPNAAGGARDAAVRPAVRGRENGVRVGFPVSHQARPSAPENPL